MTAIGNATAATPRQSFTRGEFLQIVFRRIRSHIRS